MNDSAPEKEKKYSSASVIIYSVLLLTIVITIGMPVFQTQYIYERFVNQLLDNTESEAVRTGKHMMSSVLEGHADGEYAISDEIKTYLENTVKNFKLWKIKIFSDSGEAVYSTDEEDIGKINKHDYFHDIVAKGKTYTKVVKKNTSTLENQTVDRDVVETYVPIMREGEFLGAFELYYDITVRKESMDALISKSNFLLWTLTIVIIIVVVFALFTFRHSMKERRKFENTILEMANTDKLTGSYNRRGFEELLQLELERVDRYHTKACILLIDLDHFKNVNDTYGHQSGDDVLAAVAQKCRDTLRKNDVFGRYGGEEFIVLLPETDRENAIMVAERLRQAIEITSISTSEGVIQVTISIGVAFLGDKGDLPIDKVIKHADESLYFAKENGRNQVSCTQANT